MRSTQIYISTIASDGAEAARKYGLGLEIAEYCTAWNMDTRYEETNALVQRKLSGIQNRVLHAPFNELFPCAIDPKAREPTASRYRQAIQIAKCCAAAKVVIHGGYNPRIYYPCWYTEQSVLFWRSFLTEDPGVEIVLENVLEEEPEMLLNIVKEVDDPRLRICLDVGHVNAYSQIPADSWLKVCAPYLSHFHIHNNDGSWDTHSALDQGSIPMERLLNLASRLCPDATFTLELMESESSIRWLLDQGILEN